MRYKRSDQPKSALLSVPLYLMDSQQPRVHEIIQRALGGDAAALDAAKKARQAAFDRKGERLRNAWRGPGSAPPSKPFEKMTLDEARAAAEAAWLRRGERLRNAWRGAR